MKFAGLLLLSGGLVLACSNSDSSDAPPLNGGSGSKTVVLHAGAEYVDSSLSDVATVMDDRIVFPADKYDALSKHVAGDILLGDSGGAGNPGGFLRKVVSIAKTNEGAVVMTGAATLQEAVDELSFETTLQTPALNVDGPSTQSIGTKTLHPQGGTTVKLLDYSGKQLFSESGVAKTSDNKDVPYTVSAAVETGTLSFSPKWDLKADVGFLKLKSFDVKGSGQLDAKLLLDVAVKLDPSVDAKTKADLAGKLLTRSYTTKLADYDVKLGSPSVGPFKLPSSAHFTATLSCDFAFTAPVEAKVGGGATGMISVELAYDGDKLTPTFDKSASFTPTTPTFVQDGMLRAVCTVTPKFELKLFGVATATLTADAFAGIGGAEACVAPSSRALSGDVEAGVSAKVLASVNIFGLYKWKKECTLFDISGTEHYDHTYADPAVAAGQTCTALPAQTLPPRPNANPASCFGDSDDGTGTTPPADGGTTTPIPGTCAHDTCQAGEKLGQACDECTQKVCAADSYCCDTYWGLSCLDAVQTLCKKSCGQ